MAAEVVWGDLLIREINAEDATLTAALNAELGYPAALEVVRERIATLAQLPDQVVYVACLSGEVVGWIDVRETQHLTVERRAEIGGLVVTSKVRGCGIGRCLVARAERWACERGLKSMVVRSRMTRERAHRFYLREGYAQTKTSAVFTKELG